MHHASNELKRVAQEFLSGRRDTYATVLLGILFQVYGAECLNWDPVTLEAQIKEDFEVEMPHRVYNQLMALVNVLTTDSVYNSVSVFETTLAYLCRVDPHDLDMPNPEELAWTTFEIMMNDPDPYDQGPDAPPPFSGSIAVYAGVALADAGMKRPPQILSWAKMPTWVAGGLSDDPDMYGAASSSQDEQSNEVDRFVEGQLEIMVKHLRELGIEPAPLLLEEKSDLPASDPLAGILPA